MEITIQIASLIGALSTIILGVIAIALSLYFYRLSMELHTQVSTTLNRIEVSSGVTEQATKDVIQPVVNAMVAGIRDKARSSIDTLGNSFTQRTIAQLETLFEADTEEERKSARQAFIKELDSLIGSLRNSVDGLQLDFESGQELGRPESVFMRGPRSLRGPRDVQNDGKRAMPGTQYYDWAPFIRKIRDMEESHDFLSVRWLREKRFADNPRFQGALQVAIDRELLSTHHEDNPNNPQFPTLCCRLNRDHALVRDILNAISPEESTPQSHTG